MQLETTQEASSPLFPTVRLPPALLPLAILDAPSKTVRQPFYSGGASRPAPDPPHSGVSNPLLLGGVAGAGTLSQGPSNIRHSRPAPP